MKKMCLWDYPCDSFSGLEQLWLPLWAFTLGYSLCWGRKL